MRVLFVTGAFPKKSETFIVRQMEGIQSGGMEVMLLAMSANGKEPGPDFGWPLIYARSGGSDCISRWTQTFRLILKDLHEVFQSLRIFKHGLKDRASRLITYLLIAEAYRRVPEHEVVHVQFGGIGRVVLKLKQLRVIKKPVVVAFRGQDSTQFLKKHPGGYQDVYEIGDRFLPVSEQIRRIHLSEGCPEDKLCIVRSSLPLKDFPFEPCWPPNGFRILGVGRLVPKKGFHLMIQALALMAKNNSRIRLQLIGDGPEEKRLIRLANDLKVADRIELTGWKSENEVRDAMRGSHVLVVSSIRDDNGDEEGIPNVIKEAMALGTPVVASQHGGIPEIVRDGETGFTFEEGNVGQLAELLRRIEQTGVAASILEAARRLVEEEYDSGSSSLKLMQIYRNLTEHGGRS